MFTSMIEQVSCTWLHLTYMKSHSNSCNSWLDSCSQAVIWSVMIQWSRPHLVALWPSPSTTHILSRILCPLCHNTWKGHHMLACWVWWSWICHQGQLDQPRSRSYQDWVIERGWKTWGKGNTICSGVKGFDGSSGVGYNWLTSTDVFKRQPFQQSFQKPRKLDSASPRAMWCPPIWFLIKTRAHICLDWHSKQ